MSPKLKPETLKKRRAQILEAALTSFARKGYHQTTMDDIVEEAGLSKGGVYWHFGSKKQLFLALFESLIGSSEAMMSATLASHAGAGEKLGAVLDTYSGLARDEQLKKLMPLLIDVWAQNWRDSEVNEVAMAVYERYRGPLVQLIEEGMATGEFKPVNAKALASILFAVYDGLMVQWMIDEATVDWDEVSDTVMKTLVAGLLTGASIGKDAR